MADQLKDELLYLQSCISGADPHGAHERVGNIGRICLYEISPKNIGKIFLAISEFKKIDTIVLGKHKFPKRDTAQLGHSEIALLREG